MNTHPRTPHHEQAINTALARTAGADRPVLESTVAHPARMYDYFLGGKDNYAVDRAAATAMIELLPSIPGMARANRAFLGRAVRYLARAGVAQFLDLGCGLPTVDPVHEVAQVLHPAVRVVYVDNDPLVLTHSRALLTGNAPAQVTIMAGDLREPGALLFDPCFTATLDLRRPVGVLLVSVLMYFTDAEITELLSTLRATMPPGSFLVISHPTADFDPATVEAVVQAAARAGVTYRPRTHREVTDLFADLDLVRPGVVPLLSWPTTDPEPDRVYYWAGVARFPSR